MPSALWDRDYRKVTVISVESGESDISSGFAIDLWSSVQTIPFEPCIPLTKVYALTFNFILILFPQMMNIKKYSQEWEMVSKDHSLFLMSRSQNIFSFEK